VTLGFSRHLPAHGASQAEHESLHAASQDEEERPIWAFFWSQAGEDALHAAGLAGGGDAGNQTGLGCIPWAMYGLTRATKHALNIV
jgi:hypothetical protein